MIKGLLEIFIIFVPFFLIMKGVIILLLLIVVITGCTAKEKNIKEIDEKILPEKTVPGEKMKLSSDVFQNGEIIPRKYTCQGEDINPSLKIEDIPEGTKSLALIFDDPDATSGLWSHWLVKDIPINTIEIKEDSVPGIEVINSWGKESYGGPCPPSGEHRYIFRLYALNIESFDAIAREDFYKRIEQYKIEEAVLLGRYSKN